MGETLSLFRSSFNKSLRIESRPERLTGEPGAVVLPEIMDRTRFIEWMVGRLHDPRKADGGKYGQLAFRTQENRKIRSSDGCGENSVLSSAT